MRPTGCPEEEVGAELYSSIKGQGGGLQRHSHHYISSLLVSKSVSLEHGVVSPVQDFMRSVLLHKMGIYSHPATTDLDLICPHEEKMHKKLNEV